MTIIAGSVKRHRVKTCRCGHTKVQHEHYRQGTDCSVPKCGCVRFRRRWFWQ